MLKLADGRKKLYQWDTDVKVSVEIDAEFVDFKLISSYNLLRVKVNDKIAMIPNILLQNGSAILAYANCTCNGQHTKCSAMFDVIKRPKPADYVYTETELKNWDDLETRVRTLEQGGAIDITVDAELDIESENPVQNKVVAKAINGLSEDIAKINISNAITNTASGESIVLRDSAEGELEILKVCGKSTQNGTPTPDNPIPIVSTGDDGDVDVGVYGGNLLNLRKFNKNASTESGVTFTVVNDEYITVVGTSSAYPQLYQYIRDLPNGVYVLSGSNYSNPLLLRARIRLKGKEKFTDYGQGTPFEVTEDTESVQIMIQVDSGWIVDATIKPMLNKGRIPLPYEPYKEEQTLEIPTPNGLPAIKVTDASLATYTDSDGNMWCADEVDFERGVYVQKIWKGKPITPIVFESKEADRNRCRTYSKPFGVLFKTGNVQAMSTIAQWSSWAVGADGTFALDGGGFYYKDSIRTLEEVNALFAELGTDFEVLGVLATPIETPLSAEEIEKLHTNYPTTTILSEAHLEVKYGADTKNYIDNKLTALTNAVLSMGGNV